MILDRTGFWIGKPLLIKSAMLPFGTMAQTSSWRTWNHSPDQ